MSLLYERVKAVEMVLKSALVVMLGFLLVLERPRLVEGQLRCHCCRSMHWKPVRWVQLWLELREHLMVLKGPSSEMVLKGPNLEMVLKEPRLQVSLLALVEQLVTLA